MSTSCHVHNLFGSASRVIACAMSLLPLRGQIEIPTRPQCQRMCSKAILYATRLIGSSPCRMYQYARISFPWKAERLPGSAHGRTAYVASVAFDRCVFA